MKPRPTRRRPPVAALFPLLLAPAFAAAGEPARRVTPGLTADGKGALKIGPADEPAEPPAGAAPDPDLPATTAVRTIGGEAPADAVDATVKLAAAAFGEPTEFVVLRGPDTLTAPVVGR